MDTSGQLHDPAALPSGDEKIPAAIGTRIPVVKRNAELSPLILHRKVCDHRYQSRIRHVGSGKADITDWCIVLKSLSPERAFAQINVRMKRTCSLFMKQKLMKLYIQATNMYVSQVEFVWAVITCSNGVGYQRFGEPWCLHLQGEDI
jgi:hypothetical protein